MNVKLMAHTQLSQEFLHDYINDDTYDKILDGSVKDGQIISLVAVRNCYSPSKPSEITLNEGEKYFGNNATDGKSGTEADRLFRQIIASKHTSTLEHLNYTFLVEGVSRALMAQLTRHRHLSFSIKSQRYVKFGSNDKSGGFDYVIPEEIEKLGGEAKSKFVDTMTTLQQAYDTLRNLGVTGEDSRSVMPNAATTDIVMTGNLRTLLEFYSKRKPGKGAQFEITQLAEGIKSSILEVDPWLEKYFE